MNKNIIKLFAILVMCFMIGSVLVACGAKQGEQGEQGEQGKPGAEGPQGPQGPAGESAFIGANGNWWVGETDTGVKAEPTDLRDCEKHDYTIDEAGTLYDKENKYVLSVHTKDSLGCTMWVCVDCGDTYLEWVDHKYVAAAPVAPTCTEDGYTVYSCSCGLSYKDDVVPAHGHVVADFVEKDAVAGNSAWKLDKKSADLKICDCEWERTYTTYCSECGLDFHKAGTAAGHKWGGWELSKNTSGMPDCEWIPVYIRHCTVCSVLGEDHDNCLDAKEEGTPKAHDYKVISVKNATCTEDGETVSECSMCKKTKTESIPKAQGHKEVVDAAVAPTCTTTGLTAGKHCSVCNAVLVAQEVVPALGHKFNTNDKNNYVVELPTEEKEGKISVKCITCNVIVKEIVLPKLNTTDYKKETTNDLCADKKDIYTKEITVDANNKITITVTVNDKYEHTAAPAKAECQKVEGQDKWYYVYKCGNCGLWIVAYYDAK